MLKDVVDGVKTVSDTIGNLKEIYSAVKDGYQYFSTQHPDIRKDVASMCVELRKTCHAVATASAIMTHFRFNLSPDAINYEPTRFNDYFIKYKINTNEAEDMLRSLKGSCTVIIHHAEKLRAESMNRFSKNSFLALFGLYSPERALAVENALREVYNEEKEWHIIVGLMASNITWAVRDVSDTLGPGGLMHADNIPAAAQLLNDYAEIFGNLELEARKEADAIQTLVDELNH